jgi:Trypsin-like peptidase domain
VSDLYQRLRETLLRCGPFGSDAGVSQLFDDPRLNIWRDDVPSAATPRQRVNAVITMMRSKRRLDRVESGIVLLLQALRDQHRSVDTCYRDLQALEQELAAIEGRAQPSSPIQTEGNLAGRGRLFIVAEAALRERARGVAMVKVPRLQPPMTEIYTGTGWLIGSGLLLTCLHVLEARRMDEAASGDLSLLHRQAGSTHVIFDYEQPGQAIEYRGELVACDVALDYAILRLHDREDNPLARYGVLPLDADAPLTVQTQLCVIQHPRGMPQQYASGFYRGEWTGGYGRFLYDAETDNGASGGPVLNVNTWRVIALHEGVTSAGRVALHIRILLDQLARRDRSIFDAIHG